MQLGQGKRHSGDLSNFSTPTHATDRSLIIENFFDGIKEEVRDSVSRGKEEVTSTVLRMQAFSTIAPQNGSILEEMLTRTPPIMPKSILLQQGF